MASPTIENQSFVLWVQAPTGFVFFGNFFPLCLPFFYFVPDLPCFGSYLLLGLATVIFRLFVHYLSAHKASQSNQKGNLKNVESDSHYKDNSGIFFFKYQVLVM